MAPKVKSRYSGGILLCTEARAAYLPRVFTIKSV